MQESCGGNCAVPDLMKQFVEHGVTLKSMPITASAPGKVLIAGGYLILEDGNEGLVIGVSAKVHTTLYTPQEEDTVPLEVRAGASPLGSSRIARARKATEALCTLDTLGFLVVSPQFHAAWGYLVPCTPPFIPVAVPDVATAVAAAEEESLPTLPPNPFAYAALASSLAVASAHLGEGVMQATLKGLRSRGVMTLACVQGDNDFYSQRWALEERGLPARASSLGSLPLHLPAPIPLGTHSPKVAKTGLGSSAALTSSLCGAILAWLGVVVEEESGVGEREGEGRALVHAAAQVGHCMAQGKSGSGFDVAAGVYGSLRFTRIPASLLEPLAVGWEGGGEGGYPAWCASLQQLAIKGQGRGGGEGGTPMHTLKHFALPPRLGLILGDVAGGSETPSMVRRVLAWRETAGAGGDAGAGAGAGDYPPICRGAATWVEWGVPESGAEAIRGECVRAWERAKGPPLWRHLAAANAGIAGVVRVLCELGGKGEEGYHQSITHASTVPAEALLSGRKVMGGEESSSATPLTALAFAFALSRRLLREMGEASGVGIEPPTQTRLLDATLRIPGVLAAGVPGAGGNDAVFAIVVAGCGCEDRVEDLWEAYQDGCSVTRLGVREGPGKGDVGAGMVVTVVA